MIQFGWIDNGLVVFAFQSSHNLWLLDLLNYSAISGIMFAEIDRNGRSEELVKLWGGQKNFIFRRGGGCPMRGRSENFHFQGRVCPLRERVDFLGGGSYPSAYYGVLFYLNTYSKNGASRN